MSYSTVKIEEAYEQWGSVAWETEGVIQKWKWAGHVVRRQKRIPLLDVLEMPDGRRRQGRQRKNWLKFFEDFLGIDWREHTLDRAAWRDWLREMLHELWRQKIILSPDIPQKRVEHI